MAVGAEEVAKCNGHVVGEISIGASDTIAEHYNVFSVVLDNVKNVRIRATNSIIGTSEIGSLVSTNKEWIQSIILLTYEADDYYYID